MQSPPALDHELNNDRSSLTSTDSVEDLKYLSNYYEDGMVSGVSGRICDLIGAHCQVLEQNNSIRQAASDIEQKTREMNQKLQEFKTLAKNNTE